MVFSDTNVVVYAYDRSAPEKRMRASSLLTDLGTRGELAFSTQVLKETYWVTTRKLARPLTSEQAEVVVAALAKNPVVTEDVAMIQAAVRLSRRDSIAF